MSSTYRLMSFVFLGLAVLTMLCTVSLMFNIITPPSAFAPQTAVPVPTLRVIPTLEPTITYTPTATALPPTWTPEGGQPLSNPADATETSE